MCALLDSYVPEKINYYSLNPSDSEHNSELATNVMNELGIPILVYPDDIAKTGNKVDQKTLLTQLSTAKVVLDNKLLRDAEDKRKQEEVLAREKAEEEADRIEKEKEKAESRAEAEKIAREKAEENAKIESERIEKEKAEAEARAESEKLAREKAESQSET